MKDSRFASSTHGPSTRDGQKIVRSAEQRLRALIRGLREHNKRLRAELKTLREVHRGLIGNLHTSPAAPQQHDGCETHLTRREREVLTLIADGVVSKKIAPTLGITFKTVITHRTNLMHKLNIHDVASLTRYALRIGLIEP